MTMISRFCRSCAYDLQGLPAGECPECGRAFDPDVPLSFAEDPGDIRRSAAPGLSRRADLVMILVVFLVLRALGWFAGESQSVMGVFLAMYVPCMYVAIWRAVHFADTPRFGGFMYWTYIGMCTGLFMGVWDGALGVAIGIAMGLIMGMLKERRDLLGLVN